jgi:hypothetical protein
MRHITLVAGLLLVSSASAIGQSQSPLTATEMQALVGKGLVVSSMDIKGGTEFTGRVNLEAGGKLTGTLNVSGHGSVALNGTWRLQGAQICRTLGPAQPEVVCETWVRTGPKEVVVRINGKDTSINRWQ